MEEEKDRFKEIIRRWLSRNAKASGESHFEEILLSTGPEVRAHLGICPACAKVVSVRYFSYRAYPSLYHLPPGLTLGEFMEAWRRFASLGRGEK